ncbi:MAG: gamma-glutamyl-gamma-aminobutyrate hydrolase family protein [Tepidisphaerales bacterium]
MSKVIVLQHVAHEGPGRIVPAFRDFGIPVEIRRLYAGDGVPTDVNDIRMLIVMGGPMGVNEADFAKYPFLKTELELLKAFIAIDRPVLGICLGAQVLAAAAGARVYPNVKMAPPAKPGEPPKPADPIVPLPEVGWGPINLPFPGGTEPVLFGLRDGSPMFHWHFDTFDLPRLPAPPLPPAGSPPGPPAPTGNVLLASTRICRNQAYRFKNRLFGFQFHFEMDTDGIEAMIEHAREDWQKVLGSDGATKIRDDTRRLHPEYERLGNRVIGNLVEFLKLS